MDKLEELLKEVRDVKSRVEKLENIIEQRLLGEEEPLEDERQAIREYEKTKAEGRVELAKLDEAMRELGIQRTGREKGP